MGDGPIKRSYESACMRRSKASAGTLTPSGQQLFHQVDVTTHGLLAIDSAQLCPCFVLGGADEVEKTRLWPLYIAFRALFEQGVELEQRVVVRACAEAFDVLGGLL